MSKQSTVASFVQAAPPGELSNVVADIKALAPGEVSALEPAFKQYNEEQYTAVKLPGSGEGVLISSYNSTADGRYVDAASQTSFSVDHASQTATDAQQHTLQTPHVDLIRALRTAFSASAHEHFPSSTIAIHPHEPSTIVLLLVANKYSPQNYWNGRWRSTYTLSPAAKSLSGEVKVDVHYYEDGNVRMSASRKTEIPGVGAGAEAVVREVVKAENRFQEELNRAFTTLAEGSFKGLRRQLPVTRQRVEWEKIGGYRLGQDVVGGRSK